MVRTPFTYDGTAISSDVLSYEAPRPTSSLLHLSQYDFCATGSQASNSTSA